MSMEFELPVKDSTKKDMFGAQADFSLSSFSFFVGFAYIHTNNTVAAIYIHFITMLMTYM